MRAAHESLSDSVHPIGAGQELPPEAGGKALGLRLIARAGLHVPAAWAVLPGASPADLTALAVALEARGLRSLAIRSSAADEDGGRASFAGVHETALGVPPERLRETVAAVAASALSERAVAYRRQLGLPPPNGGCAVVVQEMVDADAAGVAFGRGPDEVAIEAVEGLGEIAVNGEATPETLVLRREGATWKLLRRERRRQRVALRQGEAGPVRVELPDARQRADVLALPDTITIAAGVRALESAFGGPLDVEWAISGGRVAFLQARPQTRPVTAVLPPGQTWTRANYRDTVPDIACAFSRAYFIPALDRGSRINARRQGVPLDPAIPAAACVHGRMVANEWVFRSTFHALGLDGKPTDWLISFAGGTGGTDEIPEVRPSLLLRHPVIMLKSLVSALGGERAAHRMLAGLARARAARGTELPRDDATLLERIRTIPIMADTDHWIVTVMRLVALIGNGNFMAAPILRGLAPATLIPRLMAAEEPSVSTRQLDDLVALALRFRTWSGAAAFLADAPPELDQWRAALPAKLSAAVEEWLGRYGHRGPFESDNSQPRYRDDLRLVAKPIHPLVTAPEPPEGPEARRQRRAREAAAAWAEVARVVTRFQRGRLRKILRDLARHMALREECRYELAKDATEVRDGLRALARRLVAAGRLDAGDDVFHLELAELERAMADPAFDVRAAVRRELARRAAWRRIEVPNRFTTEEIDGMAARGLAVAHAGSALRGNAVSPGVAEASVCVLRSPEDGERMPTGAVLVAPSTDPGWTPLFARASAVVVEIGGLFSHAATVAREYGLPAVANVERATDLLRDGDLVRVDGSRGVVEIVSRAGHE
jgi:pyruvate,water dikinase